MENNIPDDSILIKNARRAVREELKRKRDLNLPITKFDPKTNEFYRVNEDGTTTIVDKITE